MNQQVEHIRSFLRPLPAQVGPVPLQSVVHDAHDLLRQEMMYQGVEFKITAPADLVWVNAEHLPLTQALVQVLRNAMQAVRGQPRHSIEAVLETSDKEAWIEVRDSGPGFTPQLLSQNFAGAMPRLDALTGQGLFMTQGILGQFQGYLSLSNGENGGARVRLMLPVQRALARTEPAGSTVLTGGW